MDHWNVWIDEEIKKVIGDGNVAHLPGAGQPLELDDDDTHTPQELRLAYRVMRDNDVVPDWMSLGRVLITEREAILRRLRRYAADYCQRLDEAYRAGSFLMERDAQTRWQRSLEKLREYVDAYNAKLLDYNITRPAQIGQRVPMKLEAEANRVLSEIRSGGK